MKKILTVLLVALLAPAAMAQAGKGKSEVAFSGFTWAPGELVEINADKMSVSLSERRAEFEGKVLVKKGKSLIYCDRLAVNYLESGQVQRLNAQGSVKLVEGKSFATGDELEYLKDQDKIWLKGSPELASEGQILLGELMVFDLNHNKLLVENPRIQFSRNSNESPQK